MRRTEQRQVCTTPLEERVPRWFIIDWCVGWTDMLIATVLLCNRLGETASIKGT